MARGALVNARVERLRAKLEEPLLVSDPANVRYLSGLASSNAALLVEPERRAALHRLPLRRERPRRRGRRVRRGQARSLPDALRAALGADRLRGVVADASSATRGCTPAASSRFPATGSSRSCAPSRTRRSSRRSGARRRSRTSRSSGSPTKAGSSAGPSASSPGASRRSCTRRTRTASRSRSSSRRARTRPSRTPSPATGASSAGETVIVDAGCMVDGYCSDCTRTFATGHASGRADARLRGLSRRAARGARGRSARGVRAGRRRGGARQDRGGRLRRGLRARARPRRRPARPRGSRASPRSRRSILAAGNVVTVEPGIYLSGLGGIRIEDLVVVREDGPEILTTFSKDLTDRSTRLAAPWPRPSTRTSSRTGCTSRSTAASGASSSSST